MKTNRFLAIKIITVSVIVQKSVIKYKKEGISIKDPNINCKNVTKVSRGVANYQIQGEQNLNSTPLLT